MSTGDRSREQISGLGVFGIRLKKKKTFIFFNLISEDLALRPHRDPYVREKKKHALLIEDVGKKSISSKKVKEICRRKKAPVTLLGAK